MWQTLGNFVVGVILGCAFILLVLRIARQRWFQRWATSGRIAAPRLLKYIDSTGKVVSGRPIGFVGFHLIVQSGERSQQLIPAGAAVDTEEFWKAWKYFGGDASQFVDEDGNPFDPTNPGATG